MTECKRCGTCCENGGPALHDEDLALIHGQRLSIRSLITIRAGEPVFSPLANAIEPSRTELIKLAGQNDSWACRFFDRDNSRCGIYEHRPLECRLLKCWAPAALTQVIYQRTLSRKTIIPADDSLWEYIELQEEHCGFAALADWAAKSTDGGTEAMREIARLVTLDLRLRQRAIQLRQLSMEEELLYFGRPLFKSLVFYQLTIQEGPQGIAVRRVASLGA